MGMKGWELYGVRGDGRILRSWVKGASQPFKSITYLYFRYFRSALPSIHPTSYSVFGELHLEFQEGTMRPVVRATEITIHKSGKIVAYGDPCISL